MISKKPIVVFRGNDICFHGITKSLAKSGIPFITVLFTWEGAKTWWSENSKFYKSDIKISNPFCHPNEALLELIKNGKNLISKWGEPLLTLPSSDTNLMFLLNNENYLSPYFKLMGDAEFNSYRNDVAHKYTCFEILSSENSNLCPITKRCRKLNDIDPLLKEIPYPAIFKPSTKDYGQSFYSRYKGSKAIECKNKLELKNNLIDCIYNDYDLVVQEKVIFDKVEEEIPFYAYVDQKHNIRIAATGIKELIQPYPFGTANILKLTWHEELLPIAQVVVKKLRWRGIIMIEFIRDKKDNQWKVIEINLRPWLFIGFYELFGLNYLETLYDDWNNSLKEFDGNIICPSKEIIRKKPIHVDINGIINHWNNQNKINKNYEDFASFYDWLKEYSNLITYPYFDIDDKEPAIKNLSEIFSSNKNFFQSNIEKYFCNPSLLNNLTEIYKLS